MYQANLWQVETFDFIPLMGNNAAKSHMSVKQKGCNSFLSPLKRFYELQLVGLSPAALYVVDLHRSGPFLVMVQSSQQQGLENSRFPSESPSFFFFILLTSTSLFSTYERIQRFLVLIERSFPQGPAQVTGIKMLGSPVVKKIINNESAASQITGFLSRSL